MSIKENALVNKSFGVAQKLGKSILLPIAILPVAGLFLGISAALTNGAVLKAYPILASPGLQIFLQILNAIGKSVFDALPLIFAVGIAVGLAKNDKGTAGLAAVVGYFVLITTINVLLKITNQLPAQGVDPKSLGQGLQFGVMTLQMSVFGGVLAGLYTSWVHNRFYKLKLPEILAFFGGSRSVPIITAVVSALFGVLMFFVWPMIGNLIGAFGELASKLGVFGAFIYGLMLRTLYICGLHHVFYLPFWTTAAGGVAEVAGKSIAGWQNIFLAQLGDPNTVHFFKNIALYNSGRYIHMLFTLPAVCLAMYHSIPDKKKRKRVLGFILSIALTCFITGVTEPISFALLFASPILFIVEAVLFAIATYFIYRFLITKLDAKTPGREEENEDEETSLRSGYVSGKAKDIIEALGGVKNIEEIDNCATRLRVTVKKIAEVDIEGLKKTGAHNTLVRGKNLQVIYGPSVNIVRVEVDEYLESLNS
ncbi:PTS transporter subunit EIIC [Haloimpatiens massiliensis]|uniref:PTS transporter subunit EIIC n=1 Tax=Haloimpatiens massiliensis TaxID=1658110 RepID=UPI000C85F996|nr:PTS transporter subunit EIIC [Haloimpatiens massiliensis]